jgi:uncharacterized protein (DUF169 family)
MNKEWQGHASTLKELLGLDSSPVALSCLQRSKEGAPDKKIRICRAILDASRGEAFKISKENNACFGASWHLGFQRFNDPKVEKLVKKFVVEGEKLFSSYQALENIISQMPEPPDNKEACFALAALEKADFKPQLVIFVCNPEQACRLLTFSTFIDGKMPQVKIGGPTCRLAVIYPLLSGETNLSFYDYTARKICGVKPDKLLVSMPYDQVTRMVANIDKCSAGRAKIEYPQEFREFLQKRMVK